MPRTEVIINRTARNGRINSCGNMADASHDPTAWSDDGIQGAETFVNGDIVTALPAFPIADLDELADHMADTAQVDWLVDASRTAGAQFLSNAADAEQALRALRYCFASDVRSASYAPCRKVEGRITFEQLQMARKTLFNWRHYGERNCLMAA